VRFYRTLGNFHEFLILVFNGGLLGKRSLEDQKKPRRFGESLIEFLKKCASSYFYFATLNKENQILLSPLIFGEQGIFHTEGNLGEPIAPLDSWQDPFFNKFPGTIPSSKFQKN